MSKATRYRLFRWVGILFAVAVFYIFSFGPVLRLCGARVGDGWPSLPGVVRFVYAPLGVAGGWFPRWYEHYISFWLAERPSPTPNHALQRTEAGVRLFSVYDASSRQPLSLSLSPLGPATGSATAGFSGGEGVSVPFVAVGTSAPTSCQHPLVPARAVPSVRLFCGQVIRFVRPFPAAAPSFPRRVAACPFRRSRGPL